jgi:heavy metal sensor kinase
MFSNLRSNYFNRLDVRLTTSSTLILLSLSLLVCLFCYYRLQHVLLKQVDKILIDETHELIDDMSEHGDYRVGCRLFESDISKRKYYQFEFRVLTRAGETLYGSQRAYKLPLPALEKTRDFSTVSLEGRHYRYRLYQRNASVAGLQDMIIQIATETRLDQELLERFLDNILWALPVILFLSICCGMLAARQPRRIIKDIAVIANTITSENLQERLPVPSARDEVRALTETINSMIERLQKSFTEIKQFTADVSHELRNPLFALKGTMEVALSRQRDPGEYRETISECLEKINFLIKLVNDLFLISRFENRKITLELTYLNLAEIIRDIFDFFSPMAQERNLTFTIDRSDTVVVSVDKTRMLQLVSNLLDNAIKFTPEHGAITVTLTREDPAARLEISDTGIGIPEHELPYIFNRFYQVDEVRSGTERGTGLGLQICKRIADAHGWELSVRRNNGPGITATVVIPLHAAGHTA